VASISRGGATFQKFGVSILPPSLHSFPSVPSLLPFSLGPALEASKEVWGVQSLSAKRFRCILKWKNMLLVSGDSEELYRWRHKNTPEVKKMTWIHQLCNLYANYKSQGRPKLCFPSPPLNNIPVMVTYNVLSGTLSLYTTDENCECRTPQPAFLGCQDTHDTLSTSRCPLCMTACICCVAKLRKVGLSCFVTTYRITVYTSNTEHLVVTACSDVKHVITSILLSFNLLSVKCVLQQVQQTLPGPPLCFAGINV